MQSAMDVASCMRSLARAFSPDAVPADVAEDALREAAFMHNLRSLRDPRRDIQLDEPFVHELGALHGVANVHAVRPQHESVMSLDELAGLAGLPRTTVLDATGDDSNDGLDAEGVAWATECARDCLDDRWHADAADCSRGPEPSTLASWPTHSADPARFSADPGFRALLCAHHDHGLVPFPHVAAVAAVADALASPNIIYPLASDSVTRPLPARHLPSQTTTNSVPTSCELDALSASRPRDGAVRSEHRQPTPSEVTATHAPRAPPPPCHNGPHRCRCAGPPPADP